MTIGQKIRAARLEKRLTQEQLAGTDLAKSYISEIERGRRRPRRITLKALAHRLKKPLSYFVEGASEEREAEVFLQLGLARLQGAVHDGALTVLGKALDLAVQQSDEVLQARIELALADADRARGDLMPAQRRVDRCLRVFSRHGDESLLAAAHCSLGLIRLALGDPSSALWALQAGLQLSDGTARDPFLCSQLHLGIGAAHRKLGNAAAARDALNRALDAAHPFRDHMGIASWHLGLADAAAGEGGFEQALEHAGRAMAVYGTLAHKRILAQIHEHLGGLDGEEGWWQAAECHYRWSATMHGAVADLPGMAQALGHLAEVLLERASPEAAGVVCEAALGLLDGAAHADDRARLLRVLGTMYRVAGRREDAKAALAQSLVLLGEGTRTQDVRLVRQELAVLALEAGDIEEARRHVKVLQGT